MSPLPRLLVGATLCCALAACGGSERGAAHPDDDVVGWQAELAEDSPTLLESFRTQSEAYGCRTTTVEATAVVERCPEGPITMTKRGLRVTVACGGMSFDRCHELFERISAPRAQ